jgi:uncharacterized protein (TIGR03067 family)
MNQYLCSCVVLFSVFLAHPKGADQNVTESTRLQGTWSVISLENSGKILFKGKKSGMTWTIAGDALTSTFGFPPSPSGLEIDTSQHPPQIVFYPPTFRRPSKIVGIYKLDKGYLTIAINADGFSPPKHFSPVPGSNLFILILERVK